VETLKVSEHTAADVFL